MVEATEVLALMLDRSGRGRGAAQSVLTQPCFGAGVLTLFRDRRRAMEPNLGHSPSPAPELRTRGFQPREHGRLTWLTVPESQLSTTGWR